MKTIRYTDTKKYVLLNICNQTTTAGKHKKTQARLNPKGKLLIPLKASIVSHDSEVNTRGSFMCSITSSQIKPYIGVYTHRTDLALVRHYKDFFRTTSPYNYFLRAAVSPIWGKTYCWKPLTSLFWIRLSPGDMGWFPHRSIELLRGCFCVMCISACLCWCAVCGSVV